MVEASSAGQVLCPLNVGVKRADSQAGLLGQHQRLLQTTPLLPHPQVRMTTVLSLTVVVRS